MGRLIELAATQIRNTLASTFSDSGSAQELRLLFSGLPRKALYDLWVNLTQADSGILQNDGRVIPVFLVDPDRESRTGESMCCRWSKVIAARGNPNLKLFVVLRYHADPVPGSVSTAFSNAGQETAITDPTGIDPKNWLRANPLLEGCVRDLRETLGLEDNRLAEELVQLLRTALSDVEELEELGREPIHQRQWVLIEDILDLAARGGSVGDIVARLGFPRTASGTLCANEQSNALRKLGDYLQTGGVRRGINALLETIDVGDECRNALEGLKSHLPPECNGSRFRASPSTYFRVHTLPCVWWNTLTVEKILTLLEDHDDKEEQPDLIVEPSSSCVLLPPTKGANYWVTIANQALRFMAFQLDEETGNRHPMDTDLLAATKARRKVGPKTEPLIAAPNSGEWIDTAPPEHSRQLTYEFDHPDFKIATCKVLVLQTYKPGFQVRASGAKKIKAIRKGRTADKADWVTSVEFPAPGRHQIDLYFDGERIGVEKAYLADAGKMWPGIVRVKEDESWEEVRVQEVGESRVLLQIPIEGDSVCTIALKRQGFDTPELLGIELLVGTETTRSTSSVFDSLATQNQQPGRRPHAVAVEAAELHAWIIKRLDVTPKADEAQGESKSRPVGIAFSVDHDRLEHRVGPELLGSTRFVSDPRPIARSTDIPEAVLMCEHAVHETLNELLHESEAAHLEELDLWRLTRKSSHREIISEYVRQYLEWFRTDPRIAGWYETYSLFMPETHGEVLEPEPTAVLLSPLHPLRLAWMVEAQDLLKRALDSNAPCPFAAVLNPSTVPDSMVLSCSTGTGEWSQVPLLSIGTSSDYWSLLWNAKHLPRLQDPKILDVLKGIGLHVNGLAAGMAEGQLRRALSDLDSLSCAQSILRVAIFSSEAGSRDCTNGMVGWCGDSLGNEDPWSSVSGRRLHVYDYRKTDQPDPEVIANLTGTTGGSVEWYRLQNSDRRDTTIDLAVLSHLGMLNPRIVKNSARSAVSEGALVRHRVRTNHAAGAELVVTESRVTASSSSPRTSSLHKDMRALSRAMEATIGSRAFQYVPNWRVLHTAAKSASYCAIASSDTDPSGFSRPEFGTYLWDYDVPSLARHGVQDSGYYLIARESADAVSAMKFAFSHLGSAKELTDDNARHLLAEVSNRGVPSLKQLSAGGSAASGELGVLTALQILQPGFCTRPSTENIAPFPPVDGEERINLLIPVDPFRDQLDALRKGLSPGAQQLRPDLLAVSILASSDSAGPVLIHLTPIEVKCRWEKMVQSQQERALNQARSLVELLGSLVKRIEAGMATEGGEGEVDLWSLAGRSVLAAWLDFGFRIYARASEWLDPVEWGNLHQRVANDVLQGLANISVASEGRLILVHHSKGSGPRDVDGDGFTETLEISLADAAIALSDPVGCTNLSAGVVQQLGNWRLYGTDQTVDPNCATRYDETSKKTDEPTQASSSVAHENTDKTSATRVSQNDAINPNQTEMDSQLNAVSMPDLGLRFQVGTTSRVLRERPIFFHPSNTKLSHLNVGIVGDMGTGKTQLTKLLVTRMVNEPQANRGVAPKFLIFDYKKDYSQPDFVNAVDADVVAPEDIPLNIMAIPPRPDGKPHRRRDWVRRANFLSDTLSKIYGGIGPVQRSRLKTAVINAYESAGTHPPVLGDVLAAYEEEGRPDSVSGILSDLVDLEVFTEDPTCVVDFGDFLSGVSVIQLNMLGADQRLKNTLVVFMLSLFYDYMIRLPKRPFSGTDPQLRYIEAMLLVDEADNIMKHDFDVLRQVLQEGREFGVGVLLASQYLSHYRRTDYDYREPLLTWFVHRVPNIVPRDLEGLGLNSIDGDTVNRVKELKNHEFFCTTLGEEGTFAMGNAFWRMYEDAWKRQRPKEWEMIALLEGAAQAEALSRAKEQLPPDISLHLREKSKEEAERD